MSNDLKVHFKEVTCSIQNLTMKAVGKYTACNCQDIFEITKWLTGEENLLYKRLVSRKDALLVAIKGY